MYCDNFLQVIALSKSYYIILFIIYLDAGDGEYKEFAANEYKDKWSLKHICSRCCDMDAFVNKVCPCLK